MRNVASNGRRPDRLNLGVPYYEYPPAYEGFIGHLAMPITPVAKKNGEYPAITRESWLGRQPVRRGSGAAFPRGGYELDMIEYNCKGYGFECPITKDQRETYAAEFDMDEVGREFVSQVLLTEYEIRVAAAMFDATTSWPSGTSALYTDVATDWDTATATIVADVQAAIEQVRSNCGMMPNTMIVSAKHIPSFYKNTAIQAQYKGGTTSVVTRAEILNWLPSMLGIPNILFGSGVYNATAEGGTLSMTDIWSDNYAWIGVLPTDGSPVSPAAARTFQWAAYGSDGFEWQMYDEPQTKTTVWQAEHWVDTKVIDPYMGHLLLIDT